MRVAGKSVDASALSRSSTRLAGVEMTSGLDRVERRALWSVAAQFFANGAIAGSFVPRLPEIRDRIDIGTGELGTLLAVAAAVGLVGSALVGVLIDRFGSRTVLIGSAIAVTCSLSVIGVASSVSVLVVGLVGVSAFDVLADSAMNLQGSQLSARRGVPVMNRLHALWSVGTLLGGVVAAQLAGAGVSLRVHLLVASAMMLGVIVFVATGLLAEDRPVADGPDDRAVRTPPRALRSGLIALAVAGGCSIAIEMTSNDWAAFRLADDFNASAQLAGFAYVAFTVGMVAGRLGGDSAIARLGRVKVTQIAMAVTVFGLVASSFAPNQWVVLAAYTIAGLGIATQFPHLYDTAARHPGRNGAGLGALTAGSKIALLLTPLIVGPLAATTLSVGTAMACVTIPAALAFVVVTRIGSK